MMLKAETRVAFQRRLFFFLINKKQGRIHGNPVADGWAGAIMQKPPGIQKCDQLIDVPMYQPLDAARCRVACLRLKSHHV